MKRVMFLLLTALACMTASAQWEKTVIEADELKGEQGGEVMIYTDQNNGSFVFWGWDEYQFRLTSDKAQFNNSTANGVTGLQVLVGIYNDAGKMVDSFKMWLDRESNRGNQFLRTRNAGTMSNPVGQKGKVKKIFNALKSGSGYVRIVAERFNTTDFDIKIPPYQD